MFQPQDGGTGRQMGLAIVHVVGALGASLAFGFFVLFIQEWEQKRMKRRRLQDAALAMGVPAAMLETDDSQVPRLIEHWSQRYSSELLSNRLSDLCGALRTAWGWLSSLAQGGVVVTVAWMMLAEGAENAAGMWLVPAVAVMFWLASVAFSFTCLVLTGRYPGEAKAARKVITAAIEQRHVVADGTAAARSAENVVS
jgi:hypothetical protein